MNPKALSRISKVIQTEATAPSIGDFLLTHVSFDNLYLDDGNKITEDELLNNVLLSNHDEHKFIMVQGGNGSGKSHLIRWLKEKYASQINNEKEAVLLISRAHNTLQDALTQLLESDIFPDKIKENELKHIKNARSNLTGEELSKTINFNFTLEIDGDSAKTDNIIDSRTRNWLSTYFKDNYIQNEFLLNTNGPIERIRSKIETTNEKKVNYNESPIFVPEDFDISISQIGKNLAISDGRAADYTIRLAEKFANERKGPELRQKVADYLNTKVSNVIQRSMKLQTSDFKKLFSSLRKTLKQQNINLTLFVEDINSFTGIDEALMEVLLTDHSAEGNNDYCRIISVVGSTNAFYRDKLNASIKERIKTNIFIEESSVLGTKEKLAIFAAKYINAINLSEEEIEKWVNGGANDSDMPIYKSDFTWSEVDCQGKKLSIFPFNVTAIWKLYNTLSPDKRTPRVFLKSIIAHILKIWFSNSEFLFTSENNFINADISMPRWENQLFNQSNINIDEATATERGILLKIWGDGTTKLDSGLLGCLSKDVFDAFNVFSSLEEYKKMPSEKIINDNTSKNAQIETSIPESKISNEINKNIEQEISVISKNLISIQDDLEKWLNQRDTNYKLKNHIELRDLLYNFIVSGIDWESENIPMSLVNTYMNLRSRVHIEGQPIAIGEGFYLERNEESHNLLIALAHFKYMGNNTWDFKDSSDYLILSIAWLERNKNKIIESIIAPKGLSKEWNLPLWNIASVYCIKTLFGGVDISKSNEDIAIELLGSQPIFKEESEHSQLWRELQNLVLNNDTYKNNLFKETFSYFSKSVGSAEAGATKYSFVDAREILIQIEKLKSLNWNLDGLCPVVVDTNKSLWYYSYNFIKQFVVKISKAIQDENQKAEKYINFFSEIFSNDFSQESISNSIMSTKDFLSFLTSNLNVSYTEEDYLILKPQNAASKLNTSITKVKKILDETSQPELLMKLSKNPFEDIQKFFKCFIAFNDLLNEKEKIFSKHVDIESKEAIEKYKDKLITDMNTIIDLLP